MNHHSNEVNEILKLYNTNPNLQWIEDNIDINCQFDGPGFNLTGKENVMEIFKAIPVYIKDMKVENSVSSTSNRDIHIDTNLLVTFQFLPWIPVRMRMLLVLHKNSENRITRFEENVCLESLIQNIPILNYTYFKLFKPSFGYVMIKLGGFSKIGLDSKFQSKSQPTISTSPKQQQKKDSHHEATMSEVIKEKMKENYMSENSNSSSKSKKKEEKKANQRKAALKAQPITN